MGIGDWGLGEPRRGETGESGVVELEPRRRMAREHAMGALPVYAGQGLSAHHRLPADERSGTLLPEMAHREPETAGRTDHRTQYLAGERIQDGQGLPRHHLLRRYGRPRHHP